MAPVRMGARCRKPRRARGREDVSGYVGRCSCPTLWAVTNLSSIVAACDGIAHRRKVVPACVCRSRPVSVSPHNFCGWPTGVRVSPIGLFSGFELVLEPPNLRDISGFPVSCCFCPSLPAPRADGRLSTESLVSSQPHGPLPQGASDFACFYFCGTRHGAGGCRPCGPGLYSSSELCRSGGLVRRSKDRLLCQSMLGIAC